MFVFNNTFMYVILSYFYFQFSSKLFILFCWYVHLSVLFLFLIFFKTLCSRLVFVFNCTFMYVIISIFHFSSKLFVLLCCYKRHSVLFLISIFFKTLCSRLVFGFSCTFRYVILSYFYFQFSSKLFVLFCCYVRHSVLFLFSIFFKTFCSLLLLCTSFCLISIFNFLQNTLFSFGVCF